MVQPYEVLYFYQNLVQAGGHELETAGVLNRGKEWWALPKTDQDTKLNGGDTVKYYLLLATSCDDPLAPQFNYLVANGFNDKASAIKALSSLREMSRGRSGLIRRSLCYSDLPLFIHAT